MHYKNGREAKVGDKVVAPHYHGPFIGTVVSASAGADTCNLIVVPHPIREGQSATASECLHVDDAVNQSPPKQEAA